MTTTNTTETTAAHSITTIESLVREARRRGFRIHGAFNPSDLIPMVEAAIREHHTRERGFTELSGDFIEWKQTMDNLQQFLALLQTLPPRLPYQESSAPPATPIHTNVPPLKPADLEEKKSAGFTGFSGFRLPPQEHPTGFKASSTGFDPGSARSNPDRSTEDTKHKSSGQHCDEHFDESEETDTDEEDDLSQDASDGQDDKAEGVDDPTADEAFDELDEDLQDIAIDLHEHLHNRSPFAKLNRTQREAIQKLLEQHDAQSVAEILRMPPPIGMNLKTSDSALNRFRHDHLNYGLKRSKEQQRKAEVQAAAVAEKEFQRANQSEQTFREVTEQNLKKRLFHAAAAPNSDYHEIRWLLKSIEMLRQQPTQAAA